MDINNSKILNLKGLSKGIYILKVETNKGFGIKKIVKN